MLFNISTLVLSVPLCAYVFGFTCMGVFARARACESEREIERCAWMWMTLCRPVKLFRVIFWWKELLCVCMCVCFLFCFFIRRLRVGVVGGERVGSDLISTTCSLCKFLYTWCFCFSLFQFHQQTESFYYQTSENGRKAMRYFCSYQRNCVFFHQQWEIKESVEEKNTVSVVWYVALVLGHEGA